MGFGRYREWDLVPYRRLLGRAGRQPMEMAVAVVSITSGVLGLVFPDTISPAIRDALEPVPRMAYLILLALGGVIALWGDATRGVQGLMIERRGLFVLTVAFLVLVSCVFLTRGVGGVASALIPTVFIICTVGRIVQIGRDLRLLKEYDADRLATSDGKGLDGQGSDGV